MRGGVASINGKVMVVTLINNCNLLVVKHGLKHKRPFPSCGAIGVGRLITGNYGRSVP